MRNRRSILIAFAALVVVGGALLVVRARAAAYRRAQASSCAGRMFPFTFVALQWMSDESSRHFPTNLTYLSNDVPLRWMICPCETSRTVATSWSSFTPEHSSYELVSPGMAERDTNSVFLRCRIHGHLAYGDMTVFDGVRRRHKFE